MIRSILDVAYLKEVVENSTAVKLAAEHLAGAGDKNMHILVECNHVVVLGIVSKNCGAVIILERILNILDDLCDSGVVLEGVVDIGLCKGAEHRSGEALGDNARLISALRTIVIL